MASFSSLAILDKQAAPENSGKRSVSALGAARAHATPPQWAPLSAVSAGLPFLPKGQQGSNCCDALLAQPGGRFPFSFPNLG